ncbi:hypothetical protein BpHYR1_021962 [Brachionus plicatilis]|uniref:Uncharacterized protein n=1 Tax=Brachionus plicatilis TaxID=10195 RepID=A0A3M7QQ10_BRAPC|nr:hypothetical protein BpHYR1_021962 [Brachionus plicatilis]
MKNIAIYLFFRKHICKLSWKCTEAGFYLSQQTLKLEYFITRSSCEKSFKVAKNKHADMFLAQTTLKKIGWKILEIKKNSIGKRKQFHLPTTKTIV